jgi:hypothetical protein
MRPELAVAPVRHTRYQRGTPLDSVYDPVRNALSRCNVSHEKVTFANAG